MRWESEEEYVMYIVFMKFMLNGMKAPQLFMAEIVFEFLFGWDQWMRWIN